jgi:FkbH-like protein
MKIAFLSNYTSDFLVKLFSKKLKNVDIDHEIYLPGFHRYNQAILDEDSSFYKFNAELVFLSIDLNVLIEDLLDRLFEENEQEIYENVKNRFRQLLGLIIKLKNQAPNIEIFIDNFYLDTNYLSKTLEGNSPYTIKNMPAKLNLQLEEFASQHQGVIIIDIYSLIQKYGEKELLDPRINYIAKSKFSGVGLDKFSDLYLSHIKAYKGLRKKVIVLDLDDTLWGGIIGEDGIENIKLSNDGLGKAFIDFQKELLKLYRQGILLAICSKNEEKTALDAIKNHPDMILREECFSAIRINWTDKVQNVNSIANELNLGIDSFVFFDDSPFEREFVKSKLPEIEVPDLPEDPTYYVDFLKDLDYFNFHKLTNDDLKRNKNYAANRERKKVEESFTDTTSFLRSLDMQLKIKEMDDFSFPRIVQLIQKTNQFNLTTRRYTDSEIRKFSIDTNYRILEVSVKDKFGDYGIIAAVILKNVTSKIYIDTFLMSCRVLGRSIETAILSNITKLAEQQKIYVIEGEIIPSARNEPALDLYKKNGFTEKGNDHWELNLKERKIKIPEFIKMI